MFMFTLWEAGSDTSTSIDKDRPEWRGEEEAIRLCEREWDERENDSSISCNLFIIFDVFMIVCINIDVDVDEKYLTRRWR